MKAHARHHALHWGVLASWVAGVLAHSICLQLLSAQPQSTPGMASLLLSFVPYLLAALAWRVTHRIRIVAAMLAVPVLLDIGWLAFLGVTQIGWDDELVWRSMQLFSCLVIVPTAFLVALRHDRPMAERPHDESTR